jgi:hypothetical protein
VTQSAVDLLAACRASPVGITTGSSRWVVVRELEAAGMVQLVRFGVRAWLVRAMEK